MPDIGLEIHHMDVQGGDSTAIIVKDFDKGGSVIYSMLIDAGAEGHGAASLVTYLEKHGMSKFDCIVATHYHKDHIWGFTGDTISFDKVLDIGGYGISLKDKMETAPNGVGAGIKKNRIFKQYCKQVTRNIRERYVIPFYDSDPTQQEPLTIDLGKNTGIKLVCYCASGIFANGKNILNDQKKDINKRVNPNDVSLACVLEWGDFRYFTAGDLSGDQKKKSYYDIEGPLMEYLFDKDDSPLKDKKITIFKASHHGSEHSNYCLGKLKPDTIITSCNMMKRVPSYAFLERLHTYFQDANEATAVFTNTLCVINKDERYTWLDKVRSFIAKGNIKFSSAEENQEMTTASNLGTKCAIIRRRIANGAVKEYSEMPIPKGLEIIKKDKHGYEIVLMRRDQDEEAEIQKTARFFSYINVNYIPNSWPENQVPFKVIEIGFGNLATQIARWLTKDKALTDEAEDATQGIDYINMHYPALAKAIEEFEGTVSDSTFIEMLKNKMVDMFNSSFKLDKGMYKPISDSKLTYDEKETFYNIMIANNHQDVFYFAVFPSEFIITRNEPAQPRRGWWNVTDCPEPYPDTTKDSGGYKRARSSSAPAPRKKPRMS